LPERLRGVETVALRQRDSPARDLLRVELTDRPLAKGGNRLPEQPAELFDRHRVDVVLGEVDLDELGEGQRFRDSSLPPQPLELACQRLRGVAFRGKAATLNSLRLSAAGPVAIRPERLSVPTRPLQLDQLAVLRHR